MPTEPDPKPAPAAASSFNHASKDQLREIAQGAKATPLTLDWLDPIHVLQAKVVAKLESAGKGYWLRQREKGSITAHMNAGMPVIGLVQDGQLLGMALLAYPDNDASSNVNGYPFEQADKTMVVQSFIVDPALEGMGVGRKLMEVIHDKAKDMGRPVLMARVATDNAGSSSTFAAAGFQPIGKPQNFLSKKHPDGTYEAQHWVKVVDNVVAFTPAAQVYAPKAKAAGMHP